MSAEFEALKKKRLKWVEANRENGFDEGIKRLLTELYPDNAHFIFELLQNAEDPRATAVQFKLTNLAVEFAHNGKRLFTFKDVESITSIGNSTKRDDATSIGKFGVGFKAVFAYTNTPEIHSGEFHFRIRDLVVPESEGLKQVQTDLGQTRFLFPFDNPKKPAATAMQEIAKGLRALGENTLLFLSHIRKIDYILPDGSTGSLERREYENRRIEIRASRPYSEAAVSHWLHFQKDVDVTDDDGKTKTCRVAIAYSLVEETNKKTEEKTWKVVPLSHGQVSIYFPAEKETSNLKFHLHAPFASTVARDSVRDCPANEQLRDHLATLIVESLTTIRDQGMLTMSFLAVLPNLRDSLAEFYEPIRLAVVEAFSNNAFTPTRSGSHAKAEALYRGPAKIAGIIDDEDLSLLTNYDTALWAANPPQMNQREDNFLDSLEIDDWDFEQLSAIFNKNDQEKIQAWLAEKNDEWMMDFYGLLKDAKESHDRIQQRLPSSQKMNWSGLTFPLVRVNSEDVKHVSAKQAYFAPEDKNISPPAEIDIVKLSVYAKGNTNDDISQPAKNFLQNIGVKPFDNKAAIELRLNRYQPPSCKPRYDDHYEDIKQFVAFWKKNPGEKTLFQNHSFLLATSTEKLFWKKPTDICLDSPLLETGLSELIEIHQKRVVWRGYSQQLNENEITDFIDFAKAIDVMYKLEVINLYEEDARKNPLNPYVRDNWTHTGLAHDYSILELEKYLTIKEISASRLVWDALINAPRNAHVASFLPNRRHTQKSVDSQLVYHLKNHAWIPNISGEFCTPQAMARDGLRDDFPFNNGNELLDKIGFGENAKHEALKKGFNEQLETQKNLAAQNLGFNSAEQAAQFAELAKQGFSPEQWLAQQKRTEQPEESVPNPERRRQGVSERSENAPSKESVTRELSIQPGIAKVVAEAKAYLRTKYTNTNRELVCQCCQQEMPFKIDDAYYFEAVQCVKTIENHHIENRLALCPTCAAMYQHARFTDDTEIRRLIVEHDAQDDAGSVEIPLTLADQERQLRFVGTHFFDLKTVFENTEVS